MKCKTYRGHVRDLERTRIEMLDRALKLIPIMEEARRVIVDRGECVSNARLATYLIENQVEPIVGASWYAASVQRTLRIDTFQQTLAARILKLRGEHLADARAEHDRSIVEAREVAYLLRC